MIYRGLLKRGLVKIESFVWAESGRRILGLRGEGEGIGYYIIFGPNNYSVYHRWRRLTVSERDSGFAGLTMEPPTGYVYTNWGRPLASVENEKEAEDALFAWISGEMKWPSDASTSTI